MNPASTKRPPGSLTGLPIREPGDAVDRLNQDLQEIYHESTDTLHGTEIRWRQFIRNMHLGLALQQGQGTLGEPGSWKLPLNLSEAEETLFQLLQYPNSKGIHPKEGRLRDIGRSLYHAFTNPEEFNRTPKTGEVLEAEALLEAPSLFRKILGNENVKTESGSGRWEHRTNGYRGNFSAKHIVVRDPQNNDVVRVEYSENPEGEQTPQVLLPHGKSPLVEFCLEMGIIKT